MTVKETVLDQLPLASSNLDSGWDLVRAIRDEDEELFHAAISRGGRPSFNDWLPMRVAIRLGPMWAYENLLALETPSTEELTQQLRYAIRWDNAPLIVRLAAAGADINFHGGRPVVVAVSENAGNSLRALLDLGAERPEPNVEIAGQNFANWIVGVGTARKSYRALEVLLDAGWIDDPRALGLLLCFASYEGLGKLVEAALRRGASASDSGSEALLFAVLGRHDAVALTLEKAGADLIRVQALAPRKTEDRFAEYSRYRALERSVDVAAAV